MIGYTTVIVGNDIIIKGKQFRGTREFWEILTRKNVIQHYHNRRTERI